MPVRGVSGAARGVRGSGVAGALSTSMWEDLDGEARRRLIRLGRDNGVLQSGKIVCGMRIMYAGLPVVLASTGGRMKVESH
jgi:hypothetical protein